ncbi:MAG: sulfur carrier protein ThiS [Bacillota bacterium]|nr:sulfur carrier protein ThiS [Bacillota bacterium]
MNIILNGEQEQLSGEKTIAALLEGLELNPDIVTVNVNGDVISKDEFATFSLNEGDEVDVLMFMGGGF